MKQYLWIEQAIYAGGEMTMKGFPSFVATMEWPTEKTNTLRDVLEIKPVTSGPCPSLHGALETLDRALQEDCAEEMMKAGAV